MACDCSESKHPHLHGAKPQGYTYIDKPTACGFYIDIDTMGPQYFWKCLCCKATAVQLWLELHSKFAHQAQLVFKVGTHQVKGEGSTHKVCVQLFATALAGLEKVVLQAPDRDNSELEVWWDMALMRWDGAQPSKEELAKYV